MWCMAIVKRMLGTAAILATLALVAGCTTTPPSGRVPVAGAGSSHTSHATPGTLPTPIATIAADESPFEVSVYQTRSDAGERTLEVSVTNTSPSPVRLLRATFTSPLFAAPSIWQRGTELPAGVTRDLRVALPEAVCPAPTPAPTNALTNTTASAAATVELIFDNARGTATSVTHVAGDPLSLFQRTGKPAPITAQDCVAAALASHVTITPRPLRLSGAGGKPATLELAIRAADAPGSATLESASETILFALVDASGHRIQSMKLGTTIAAGTADSIIGLRIVPNRCDPHAVAEDKRGTFFPLTVSTSEGVSGVVYVAMPAETRVQLYNFVADYCGY